MSVVPFLSAHLGSAVWDSVISCFDGPDGREDIEPRGEIILLHSLPLLLNPVIWFISLLSTPRAAN